MIPENPVAEKRIDEQAEKVQKLFQDFLSKFEITHLAENYEIYAGEEAAANKNAVKYYERQVEELKNNDKKTLYVDFSHLSTFDPTFELREAILSDYYR